MEVILLERIEKLGQMGEVVKVKPGFARNYLLPQKKALRASKDNLTYFETQRAQLEALNLNRRSDAEAVAAKMDGVKVVIVRQAGESGQLYGSVSARDLADAIKAAGYTVERRQINLDQPIKTLGTYAVKVSLHPEVSVTASVTVARSLEEAERAAQAAAPAAAEEAPADEAPAAEAGEA
jgi:large subunit ribosomal protein L9